MKREIKLTKKSLDELARTMDVIPEEEQENYWGMYDGDCFWRCVAYLSSGGSPVTEMTVDSLAFDYFIQKYGFYGAVNHLSATYDASIDINDAKAYAQANSIGGMGNEQIFWINPSMINAYASQGYYSIGNGIGHYVVYKRSTGTGYEVYDPQLQQTFHITNVEGANSQAVRRVN